MRLFKSPVFDMKGFGLRGDKEKYLYALAILILVILSRILLAEQIFYDADTIGVALATQSFSLEDTRPHLPGYYLHVQSIKFMNIIFNDLHSAMMFITIFYCSVGALLSFILLAKFLELKNAFLCTLLVVFNPLVWYQTITPEVYAFDFFFSALVFIAGNKGRYIYILPILFAIATGVRQTSGVLLLPLYLHYWYKFYKSDLWNLQYFFVSHFAALIVFIIWFIPFTNSAGGIMEYFRLYKTNSPLPRITLLQHLFQFSSYVFYLFVPLLILFVLGFLKSKSHGIKINETLKKYPVVQMILWIVFPLLVFTFFTYHKGYFLLIITPIYFLIGILLNEKILSRLTLIIVIVAEIAFFLLYPYRDTSIESLLKPSMRQQNLLEVWIDRTFNSYLMARSRIEKQEENLGYLSQAVGSDSSIADNNYIFLDPTVNLYARALQFKFPDKNFVTMDQFNKNHFVFYSGMDIKVKDGFRNVLKETVLITRKDFYDKELSSYLKKFSTYGGIVRIDDEKVGSIGITQKYDSLFLR